MFPCDAAKAPALSVSVSDESNCLLTVLALWDGFSLLISSSFLSFEQSCQKCQICSQL